MRSIILLIGILVISHFNSQTFDWGRTIGGTSTTNAFDMSVDDVGNVYLTGRFSGTVDFDPGVGVCNLTSNGSQDIFIEKLDSAGNFLWAKSFGSNLVDYSFSIKVDNFGNVYSTGYFQGTVDFDPGPGSVIKTSKGGHDVYVHKLDSAGNFIWVKTFGGSDDEYGASIDVDASGNVYTLGNFGGTVDFDPGVGVYNLSSAGYADIFIQKMDSSGNYLWVKSIIGTSNNQGYSIAIDKYNNVIATGIFQGIADFDPSANVLHLLSNGDYDLFVQKMDSLGNLILAKSIGGISADAGYSVSSDDFGNIYVAGTFSDTVDFDPGLGHANLTSGGGSGVFVLKLSTLGEYQWVKSAISPSSYCAVNSIKTDSHGNSFVTGGFFNSIVFDPTNSAISMTAEGAMDVFIQKINSTGDLVWVKSIGGKGGDAGQSIDLDSFGNIFTSGIFSDTIDLNPNIGTAYYISSGSLNSFVQKMTQCIESKTESITACNNYTWIDGNNYTGSNNTAQYTFWHGSECDSIITLNLTINGISDLTITVNGGTISAANSNATYRWLNCDNNFAVVQGEISQSFSPLSDGNYAVELSENGCIDTSECVSVISSKIDEFENDFNIEVFPNPASDVLYIEGSNDYYNGSYLIYSLDGRMVQSGTLSRTIDIEGFKHGVYLIAVYSDDGSKTLKFVKE